MGMIEKSKWDGMEEGRRMGHWMADGLSLSFPDSAAANFHALPLRALQRTVLPVSQSV